LLKPFYKSFLNTLDYLRKENGIFYKTAKEGERLSQYFKYLKGSIDLLRRE